jgi:hypothetical protein
VIPEPVDKPLRNLPVSEKDMVLALNNEVIPVLRAVRQALNDLILHLSAPPAVTGSRADPEQSLAIALAALDALGLLDDQSTP